MWSVLRLQCWTPEFGKKKCYDSTTYESCSFICPAPLTVCILFHRSWEGVSTNTFWRLQKIPCVFKYMCICICIFYYAYLLTTVQKTHTFIELSKFSLPRKCGEECNGAGLFQSWYQHNTKEIWQSLRNLLHCTINIYIYKLCSHHILLQIYLAVEDLPLLTHNSANLAQICRRW